MSEPHLRILPIRGIGLALWEWPGDGPALVFAHALGFHARSWDQVIRHLPGRRALAIDLRGHGRSAKPAPPYPWPEFALDLAEVARQLDLSGAIGIGHSLGGYAIAAAAIARRETFERLLLIDPSIFPPQAYGAVAFDSSFIARRRRYWSSPEDMFASFRPRPPFADWDETVLRDYCQFGLLPAGDRFELACPPEIEASIYPEAVAAASNPHARLAELTMPVTLVRAGIPWDTERFDLRASPTAPDLAARFPNAREIVRTGRSHFIPMETPDWVAAEIEAVISGRTAPNGGPARP